MYPQLRERFANAKAEGPVQGMGLPLASKRWPISGDGFMLIGDAAHLIDPFTGEGISHAMISGVHAANVAAEALQGIREEQAVPQAAIHDSMITRSESISSPSMSKIAAANIRPGTARCASAAAR